MHLIYLIPLYIFTFAGVLLIIRSFVQIFKPHKRAKNISAIQLDTFENIELYNMFHKI